MEQDRGDMVTALLDGLAQLIGTSVLGGVDGTARFTGLLRSFARKARERSVDVSHDAATGIVETHCGPEVSRTRGALCALWRFLHKTDRSVTVARCSRQDSPCASA